MNRKAYPSDVNDDAPRKQTAFMAPYLTLMREDAPQRLHDLREVFNGVRWIVRAGAAWRMMPHDLPPWDTVYQQVQRWIAAGVFAAMIHDLRVLLRLGAGRGEQPTAGIFDGRIWVPRRRAGPVLATMAPSVKKAAKCIWRWTLGYLLGLHITATNEQERAQVAELAHQVREVTEHSVEVAFVDQGDTGDDAWQQAADHRIALIVVKLPKPRKALFSCPNAGSLNAALLGQHASAGWRNYERLAQTLAGLHYLAFATLMVAKAVRLFNSSA